MLSQFLYLLNIKIKQTFALNTLHVIIVPIELTLWTSALTFSRCAAPTKLPVYRCIPNELLSYKPKSTNSKPLL